MVCTLLLFSYYLVIKVEVSDALGKGCLGLCC